MKTGIAVAGNLIVDNLKEIEYYPDCQQLTTIVAMSRAAGGLVPNVALDLALLDSELPVSVIGAIGDDADGDFLISVMKRCKNIDTSGIVRRGTTSFTDVMADRTSKTRTFFQFRGANAAFGPDDIRIGTLNARILHIGYILLLDAMDAHDDEYGTVLARVLCEAQGRGILTSVDVVSEMSGRMRGLVPHSLRYADLCVINELEASEVTGISIRNENAQVIYDNIPAACAALKGMGVSRWVVIHAPEFGAGMDASGGYILKPSLLVDQSEIKGTVGAGDAFCSGVLYGAYHDFPLERAIETGIVTAAMSLREASASDGVRPYAEIADYYATHEKQCTRR